MNGEVGVGHLHQLCDHDELALLLGVIDAHAHQKHHVGMRHFPHEGALVLEVVEDGVDLFLRRPLGRDDLHRDLVTSQPFRSIPKRKRKLVNNR